MFSAIVFQNRKISLAFFQYKRYNDDVKYFEVFLFYFINSDIRKQFMEIRNLITFTKVAETQSLSKAAAALGYAQSTVTMQMQQLEQELGTQLYERVGRQIRITQTGQEFLTYAAAIIRMSEEALMVGKQDNSTVTGSLRLGILSPLAGPDISSLLAQYLQKYPQVKLRVETIQDPELLLSHLRHNEVDLALSLGSRYTGEDLIHATEDQPAPLHLYVGKGHPLAGQQSVTPEELSLYPFIRTGYFEAGLETLPCAASRQIQISDPGLALSVAADHCTDRLFRTGKADGMHGTPDANTCTTDATGTSSNVSGHAHTNAMVLAPELIVRQHQAAEQLVPLDYEVSASACWLQVLYHRNKWLTGAMKAWLSSLETGL
ncbi:MAG TPA: hypothetical protein DD387_08155 [Lachnoclostridium sp.]|nr:hypothetical protein [Lachnoclostridium sp.]